jgi:cation transport regulator ChaC
MALVFQYGSNCSESEINRENRLRGDAKFAGIAETVEDFELAFDVHSTGRACAASDIVRRPGAKVWGVLYNIPDNLIRRDTAPRGRKSLDAIEGQCTNYKRETIKVRRPDGDIVEALTYTVKDPQLGLRTNADYVRHIVCGLREHEGVPNEYIAKVKAIAAANNPDIAAEVQRL